MLFQILINHHNNEIVETCCFFAQRNKFEKNIYIWKIYLKNLYFIWKIHNTFFKLSCFIVSMYFTARGPQYTISTEPDHHKPFLEVRNATYHGIGPREEARAMCSVKTQEVNATANATITRRLHGVVTSSKIYIYSFSWLKSEADLALKKGVHSYPKSKVLFGL